jgi:hypothetical protein
MHSGTIRSTGATDQSRVGRGAFAMRIWSRFRLVPTPLRTKLSTKHCRFLLYVAHQMKTPGRKPRDSTLRSITRDSLSRTIHLVRQVPDWRLDDPVNVFSLNSHSRLAPDCRPGVDGGPIRAVIIVCGQCLSRLSGDAGSNDEGHDE